MVSKTNLYQHTVHSEELTPKPGMLMSELFGPDDGPFTDTADHYALYGHAVSPYNCAIMDCDVSEDEAVQLQQFEKLMFGGPLHASLPSP